MLKQKIKQSSINSYIISINKYLNHLSLEDHCINTIRIQQSMGIENIIQISEYKKLLNHLENKSNKTTYLIIRTLASSGIRVSELKYLTVEVIKKDGKMEVTNKNKTRTVLLGERIIKELKDFCIKKISPLG